MLISIINGSSRQNSQSEKVARYIKTLITEPSNYYCVKDFFPTLWQNEALDGLEQERVRSPKFAELSLADAFVIVTPEWDGMVPPALKNLFLKSEGEFAHKPALIVSLSTGQGGSYPVAELRMSSYKNSKISYIPDHVIVREVGNVLNDSEVEAGNESDALTRERIKYAVKMLMVYAKAFIQIRGDSSVDLFRFPYGM